MTEDSIYGEHESAEAVLLHLAAVDHDIAEESWQTQLPSTSGVTVRLRALAGEDGAVAEALGQLGDARANEIYLAERTRLRNTP